MELTQLISKGKYFGPTWFLRNGIKKIKNADSFMQQKSYDRALNELLSGFLFCGVKTNQQATLLRDHHQSILTRIVLLADEQDRRIENIAELEKLILERAELQLLFCRVVGGLEQIASKRAVMGKALPRWSKDEYQNRIVSIKSQLTRNKEEIKKQVVLISAEFSNITQKYIH